MVRLEHWWRRLPAGERRSGRTGRGGCQMAGVHVSSFYRWTKLLDVTKTSGAPKGAMRRDSLDWSVWFAG
jgi:hypothetical protein